MGQTMNKVLFNEILQTQSHSRETHRMEKTIKRIAERMGGTIKEDNGNIYVTKGNATLYPCVVAHTDTVHRIVPHHEFVVRKQRVTTEMSNGARDMSVYYGWNPVEQDFTGIGGDDKVGIFAALSMLERFDAIKVAFFRDEEIGCVGSGLADMDFFKDVSLVLECDRQGNGDFVERIGGSKLYGNEFSEAIGPILKEYGYRETSGMMTDVQALKEAGLDVACANMSCGYWSPHTAGEYIVIEDVQNCLNMVQAIITQLGNTKWEHKALFTHNYYHGNYEQWTNRPQWTGKTKKQKKDEQSAVATRSYRWVQCSYCENENIARFDDTENLWYCTGCLENVSIDEKQEDTFAFLDMMDREWFDD